LFVRGQTEPSGDEDKKSKCHKVTVRQDTKKDNQLFAFDAVFHQSIQHGHYFAVNPSLNYNLF
jgi:hypothetical protein